MYYGRYSRRKYVLSYVLTATKAVCEISWSIYSTIFHTRTAYVLEPSMLLACTLLGARREILSGSACAGVDVFVKWDDLRFMNT